MMSIKQFVSKFHLGIKSLLDFLLGALLPFGISYMILHKLFESQGFFLYWDTGYPLNVNDFIYSHLTYAWDNFASRPNDLLSFIQLIPFAFFYWIGLPADISEKLMLLTNYALTGTSIYLAMRLLLPKLSNKLAYYAACSTAILFYMLSLPVVTQLHVPGRMVMIMSIPIGIALYIKTLETQHKVLTYSLATAFAFTLSEGWSPMLPIMIVVALIYQIYRILIESGPVSSVSSDLKKNFLIALMFVLINANWIFSHPFVNELLFRSGQNGALLPEVGVTTISLGAKEWFSLIKLLTLSVRWDLGESLLTDTLRFAIPFIVFLSLLLVRNRSYSASRVLFHALLAVISISLATWSYPLGDLKYLFIQKIEATGLLLKFLQEPSGYISLLCYSYAFLAAVSVAEVLTFILKKISDIKSILKANLRNEYPSFDGFLRIASALFLIIILVTSTIPWILYSYPAIADRQSRIFNPVEVPEEYYNTNDWLKLSHGSYRVWWLPRPLYTMFAYNWSSSSFTGGWVDSISSKPILWDSGFTTYNYLLGLLEGINNSTGKVLSIAGVKYIVLHADLLGTGLDTGGAPLETLLSNLQKQRDLRLAYRDGFIYVFENENYSSYVYAPSKIALIVGGFNTLSSLIARKDFDSRNYAVIFTEQISSSFLKELLPLADTIFFSQTKGLEDLYLQLAQEGFVYPAQYVSSKHSSGFEVGGGDTTGLFLASQRAGKHFNQEGDFLYGSSSVSSSIRGATMKITVTVMSKDNYEVWIRVLCSPLGGRLSVYMDGNLVGIVDTNASYAYLKWIKVNDIILEPGTHEVTIKNELGDNVVNVLLIAPKDKVSSLRKFVINELSAKKVIVVQRSFIAPVRSVDQSATDPNIGNIALYGEMMVAQSFVPNVSTISGIGLYKYKAGSPGNLVVELRPADEEGTISSAVLASVAIRPEQTSAHLGRFDYIDLPYNGLKPGEKYWIVVYQEGFQGDPNNYYAVEGIPNVYPAGYLLYSKDKGLNWMKDPSRDLFFQTYFIREEQTYDLQKVAYSRISLYSWNLTSNTVHEIKELPFASNNANVLNFSMPFPGKYIITVDASSPFILIIPESYTPLWRIGGIEDSSLHFPAYSFLNGYYINKTGILRVTIEYTMNTPFEIGKYASISSMIALVALVNLLEIRFIVKKRKDKILADKI